MIESAEEPREVTGALSGDHLNGRSGDSVAGRSEIGSQLVRRRQAALRLPTLEGGRHDPLEHHTTPDSPGTFGLTADELRSEANRLALREGWQLWEIAARLAVAPRTRHGACCCPGEAVAA